MINGAIVTRFVVNPNAALSQVLMRTKGGVTNYYIYGLGLQYEITETATTTNTTTYHFDFRGSTIALTDANGNVTDRVEYSPYATTTYRSGTNDTPFLYNGRYGVQTDANGLLYMRARYYNALLGRFINADPSGFLGGLNFYAYADGNPVSMNDPFGLYGNPVSGSEGPVGPSSPYAPGGAFYVSTPQPPPIQLGPVGNFVGGVIVGVGAAVVVTLAAPVVVSGLIFVGVPATYASATVTFGLGATAVVGGVATGVDTYNNAVAGNWNAVAFNAGTIAGGSFVGIAGGGRSLSGSISGQPSSVAKSAGLFGDNFLAYNPNYPNGSVVNWFASGPTPQSGGAAAALTGSGLGLFVQPPDNNSGSWINPSSGQPNQSSPTGK